MKQKSFLFALAGLLLPCISLSAQDFAWSVTSTGFKVSKGNLTRSVDSYGKNAKLKSTDSGSFRINTQLDAQNYSKPSICVIVPPVNSKIVSTDGAKNVKFDFGNLKVEVDKDSCAMKFFRADGSLIVAEKSGNPVDIKKVEISNAPTYEVTQKFTLKDGEAIYGLGQCVRPYINYRNQEILIVQANIPAYMNVITSSEGYGLLWDIHSQSILKDNQDGMSIWAESAPAGSDYYLMVGNDLEHVLAEYRHLTGSAPMFSKEAFGLFMCKERYKSAKEITGIVETFRKLHYPLDYIVQDWQYWEPKNEKWCSMEWDSSRYPDPKGMIDNLHNNLHVNLMISIWPTIGSDSDLARELDAKGLLFKPVHWISKNGRVYDAYSKEGRDIYFKHIKKGLLDVGVDALWMDGTEVETRSACHDQRAMIRDIKENGVNAMGDFTRYLNSYSLLTTIGTYQGQRATSTKRVFTLTRSAWAGQQRNGALPWSGDTTASWNCLKEQIVGGIAASLSGLPYWTQDTGGFFINYNNYLQNKEYQELLVRWNQFAVFNPVYRWHVSGKDREPFRFKDIAPTVYQTLLEGTQLRYRLFPYVYSLAWRVTNEDYTMTRGLVMDFPKESKFLSDGTKFMFGPAFLVQPVTEMMVQGSSREETHTPVEAAYFTTPDGKPGVQIEYFDDEKLRKSVSTAIDSAVDYTWPGPPLVEWPKGLTGNGDHFSARVTGYITPPETGTYEMGITGDDGYRLWIDDKLIVEDWAAAAIRYGGAKINLTKGKKVKFRIDYYQNLYTKQLTLCWTKPSEFEKKNDGPKAYPVKTDLPEGADWFDFWSGKSIKGGTTATTDCPLNRFPLFVRAGSIVPMADGLEYTTQKPLDDLEIRVYPGADATFTLYEDEGNNYNYEKGAYSTIDFKWNQKTGKLTIADRKGTYPGMLAKRTFRIVLVGENQGAGLPRTDGNVKRVEYMGKTVSVSLK